MFAVAAKTSYFVRWSRHLKTSWDVDRLEVLDVAGVSRRTTEYGATLSDDGAHIILPQGAQSFELGLRHRQLFENYAREHGADWLERFRDRLGWPRSNSIYLLTGYYKTCSWSIASFGMRTAANTDPVRVHCTLVEVDERTIRDASVWQPAGRFKRKIGPPPDRQGQNNQTIFIRGITVTPSLSEQEPSEHREGGLLGRILSLSRSLNPLAGDSNRETATETPKSNVIIQHVPQISQASHPSEMINQYLLRKEPFAKIAVTHDSQWIAMLKLFEGGQSWTLEDLENRLEALVPVHYSIVTQKDTVYLKDKEHELPTHSGVDQLRLPNDLASDITLDKKPHSMDLSSDRINLRSVSSREPQYHPYLGAGENAQKFDDQTPCMTPQPAAYPVSSQRTTPHALPPYASDAPSFQDFSYCLPTPHSVDAPLQGSQTLRKGSWSPPRIMRTSASEPPESTSDESHKESDVEQVARMSPMMNQFQIQSWNVEFSHHIYRTQALQPSMTFQLSESKLQPIDDPENRHMLNSPLDMNIVADDESKVTHPSPSSTFPTSSSIPFEDPRLLGPSTNSRVGDQRPSSSDRQKRSKLHQCELCKKMFARLSGLAIHMNSHSGAKPFKCVVANCEKSFAVRSNAKRHLRTHGINPSSFDLLSTPHFAVGFEEPMVTQVYDAGRQRSRSSSSAADGGSRAHVFSGTFSTYGELPA
ncbi:hypothetical protein J3R82DRAFT_7315 [Butyriboletus roseoflavus]|nr:hypothetical protein J3R82DRAFT_7315 [Butyriboletus roseoflavus]